MRGTDERLLYYSALHDPMPATREVFADASGKPQLARVDLSRTQGEFSILAPDLPAAKALVFHAALMPAASPRPSAAADVSRFAARQLARIPFKELRVRAAGATRP